MNGNTGGSRGPRRAGALAVVAAVAVLTTACGAVHFSSSGGSASTGSASFRANLGYAQCMQTHGVPNFPDPTNSSESFHISGHPNGNSSVARANDACQHLLPRGNVTANSGHVTQQQLDLVLKIVQCLRTHGEPNVPDPTAANGSLHIALQPSVVQSAQFRAAVNACRSLLPKGVQLP
jgi:hypothetical protein